jgi:hypothetical protein
MGEGWNASWTARSGSIDMGAPVQIDGGSNGWWLPAHTTSQTITLRWPPQQSLDRSLLVSAAAILVCCVLAFRRRSGAVVLADTPPTMRSGAWGRRSLVRSVVVALGIIAATALFASPTMALWSLAAAVLVVVTRRPRLAVGAGVALLGMLALIVLVQHYRHGFRADAGWPLQFERWHPWGMLAVTLVGAGAALDADSPRTPATPRGVSAWRPGR